ncbi:MAG: hypothetical protein JSV56_10950 [Methanomassiliicoccales archaeon]|nr:MAG: hypothetical protein JSV56_10950 [Methanomassiliicoccales archaeon]
MPENGEENEMTESTQNKTDKLSAEQAIKAYIGTYIDSYMDYVEELNLNEADFPLFYTYYPFVVRGYILPDNSTCILFEGLASSADIIVEKADFNSVDSEITKRKFDHICCYPPSHLYTKEEARFQARKDVDQDVENARALGREKTEFAKRDETLKSIKLLNVTIPWIGTRKTEQGTLRSPPKTEATKFTFEELKIKENEDFSSYSERVKNLETAIFTPSKKESVPAAGKAALTPSTPLSPPPVVPQGANISIEIKQPEAPVKEEKYDEKKDLDILRLKKTLYIQTTDIEDLRRRVMELTNKFGNIEQMRQTVFRMNRKVYDMDARMSNVEKTNRDTMKKVAEMRAEQREENKKMRRFITEKAKKSRNQAMMVGFVAIAISLVTLFFGLPLIVEYWDVVSNFFGF